MTDFFARLAARAVGAPGTLTARAPHRFESARSASPRGVTAASLEAVVESVVPALEDAGRRAPLRGARGGSEAVAREPARPRSRDRVSAAEPLPPRPVIADGVQPVGTPPVPATPPPVVPTPDGHDVTATSPRQDAVGAVVGGMSPDTSRAAALDSGTQPASAPARATEHPAPRAGEVLHPETTMRIDASPPRAPVDRLEDDATPGAVGVAVPDLSELVARHVVPALIARGLTGTHEPVQVVLDDRSASGDGVRAPAGLDPGIVRLSASPARVETTPGPAATGRRDRGVDSRSGATDSLGISPRRREPAPPTVTVNIDRVVVARPTPAPRPVPPAAPARARTPSDHTAYLARRREGR